MPELPTSTVTFLFTDLDGSSRLWDEHQDAMRAAVARHDALRKFQSPWGDPRPYFGRSSVIGSVVGQPGATTYADRGARGAGIGLVLVPMGDTPA